jgi:hypothetical protein
MFPVAPVPDPPVNGTLLYVLAPAVYPEPPIRDPSDEIPFPMIVATGMLRGLLPYGSTAYEMLKMSPTAYPDPGNTMFNAVTL